MIFIWFAHNFWGSIIMCPFASNYPYSSVRLVFWAVRIIALNLPLVGIFPPWIRTVLYYLHYFQHWIAKMKDFLYIRLSRCPIASCFWIDLSNLFLSDGNITARFLGPLTWSSRPKSRVRIIAVSLWLNPFKVCLNPNICYRMSFDFLGT